MHAPLAVPHDPDAASRLLADAWRQRLAMFGHDLNNILQAATAAIGLALQGGRLAPADSALLDVADQALQQGAGMARLFLGDDIPRPCSSEQIDLVQLLREMEPLLRHALGPGMQLELETRSGQGRVHGERSGLQRALVNLVFNAREACPSGSRLRLSTEDCTLVVASPDRAAGRYLALRVADDGPGIPPAIRERLFEPGTSSKGEGRGLGLAQVRAAVEPTGGFVDVYSSPRRGTCFVLALPCVTP
ncbi:TPA: hypothetical protein QDZ34_002274 [Stenotrophomonas maltophilia]|nr:hypothetical protein [Stenotrophomonas maltophilia]HDS1026162.1 hypothetical protein [Stenotrophomonas maltophilia]HDS1030064.1 hypothetical protein [Stenotrophomonas maltophilia]HDS1034917.1 hypothetical protein [Stenotrophomonas maltophilia]